MIHARSDYNRIQDPSGLIPDNEPVILFRAQDKHFKAVLEFYKDIVMLDKDYDPRIPEVIDRHLILAEAWPIKKRPDL